MTADDRAFTMNAEADSAEIRAQLDEARAAIARATGSTAQEWLSAFPGLECPDGI